MKVIKEILTVLIVSILLSSCQKEQSQSPSSSSSSTTDNIKIILSVHYGQADSIEFVSSGAPIVSYFKNTSKEYDYTLTNNSGTGKYDMIQVYEDGASWKDLISMEIIVNGSEVFSKSDTGRINYQINY